MNLQLKDKVVIVTGGARGIGEGIVRALADEGGIPVIVGKSETDNMKLLHELESLGVPVMQVTAELTNPRAILPIVESVLRRFGRIEGLVNNAGINDGVGLESGSYDTFMESLHRNVVHYYLMAQAVLPELIKTRGAIVNITSKTSLTGQGGTSAYAAANGARNALTREWAVELLKYQIRVNAVMVAECYTPLYENWINTFTNPVEKLKSITNKIPLGKRMTTTREIADMVIFLLSEKSSHTTGQIMHVDGGYVHLDRALSDEIQ